MLVATSPPSDLFRDSAVRVIPGEWEVSWSGGPTEPQMRDLVAQALADDAFAELRRRRPVFTRGTGARAWAARAVTAHRTGELERAIAARAALHRDDPGPPTLKDWTPEGFAMLHVVEERVDTTPFPDLPTHPEDAPVIDRLVNATGGKLVEMGRLILAHRFPEDIHGDAEPFRSVADVLERLGLVGGAASLPADDPLPTQGLFPAMPAGACHSARSVLGPGGEGDEGGGDLVEAGGGEGVEDGGALALADPRSEGAEHRAPAVPGCARRTPACWPRRAWSPVASLRSATGPGCRA